MQLTCCWPNTIGFNSIDYYLICDLSVNARPPAWPLAAFLAAGRQAIDLDSARAGHSKLEACRLGAGLPLAGRARYSGRACVCLACRLSWLEAKQVSHTGASQRQLATRGASGRVGRRRAALGAGPERAALLGRHYERPIVIGTLVMAAANATCRLANFTSRIITTNSKGIAEFVSVSIWKLACRLCGHHRPG